jgi:hypothetical protein
MRLGLGPDVRRRGRRTAYTLLEVLLAAAIGVMVMAALYVAVDVQLRLTRTGREVIEQGTLVRALLARIGSDISTQVAPIIPPGTGSSGASGMGSGGTAGSGATGAASTQNTSSATNPATSSGSSASSSSTSGQSANSTVPVPYNLGVQGSANLLILSLTKFPREINVRSNTLTTQTLPVVSDERRISYWLAGEASTPLGLARQELKLVTSDDATAMPPNVPDEASYVIAEEVKSLTFQYFDGNGWQDSWDGTAAGADGSTPKGPPLAIAITIGVAESTAGAESQANLKLYRHVVAIPTANGATQANTNSNSSP